MPSDTSPEVEKVLIDLVRHATVAQRVARMRSLTATVIALSRRAIARANPELSPGEVDLKFVELHYGRELADALRDHWANQLGVGDLLQKAMREAGASGLD